ncbi:F-box protein At5g07610-like [Argentina anserina]|uniref:F-box protein At5g07610-like n=1 Tax=Argentina anserina TaxID=57926 RepID=UPI00217664B4|nr:F-box protein At5g07610-like [Potentilla anserina]XP_050373613.1 F-box protein At5g07610-like [Potentilla anserina]
MDRARRGKELIANKNSMIYLDLKDIIKDHALPFLPAKSLFRFSGVCKDWKMQIRSPFFAHKQSTSFSDVSGFFLASPSIPPSFVSIDSMAYGVPDPSLMFLPEPVDIRASCNGLLCCQGREGYKAYYVCNAVTKQWKKLPKPNASHGSDPAVVLIFKPSLFNFVAEYKLVCAFPSVDFEGGHEFEIYSSKEGSWRISGEIIYGSGSIMPRSGVYANDIIYWRIPSGRILAFDLRMERAQLLYGHGYHDSVLGVIDGKLCSTRSQGNGITVSVLSNAYTNTMQMYSKARAWESKLSINLTPAPGASMPGSSTHNLLFASGNLVLYRIGSKLYSYNLRTKETLFVSDGPYNGTFVPHVNSLVEI